MPLSTSGRFIVDAKGNRVRLAGINWYGANEDSGLPPGLDRCWWALNPHHGKATTPATNKLQYDWGDREPYGALAEDWSGVANPAVMTMLQEMIRPSTGPGVN
jgi:hypothetical protein